MSTFSLTVLVTIYSLVVVSQIIGIVEECQRTKIQLEIAKRAVSSMVSLMHWLVSLNNQTLSTEQVKLLQLVIHAGMEETNEEVINLISYWIKY